MSVRLTAAVAAVVGFGFLTSACGLFRPVVGPDSSVDQWRIVTNPGGADITSSFGAECTSPCMMRVPDEPFTLTFVKEGRRTTMVRYDPDRAHDLAVLIEHRDDASDTAAADDLEFGGGVTMGADFGEVDGAADLGPGRLTRGAVPWAVRSTRRLTIRLPES